LLQDAGSSLLMKSLLATAGLGLAYSQMSTPSSSCVDESNRYKKKEMNSSTNSSKATLSSTTTTTEPSKKYPMFTLAEVAKHDGKSKESNGQSWVTYGNGVYDISEFIASHPGGASKIKLAAGQSVEPFWSLFPFHMDLQLVKDILKTLQIGVLDPLDVAKAEKLRKEQDLNNPFSTDPKRHPALILHSDKPCNAEVPDSLLTESYITPSELFFIR
jgi:cytochrome b involved in lipid metabolism